MTYKNILSIFVSLSIIFINSCVENNSPSSTSNFDFSRTYTTSTTFVFNFINNIHSSMSNNDWLNEFNLVMNYLYKVIPVKTTDYFSSLDIYAWNKVSSTGLQNKYYVQTKTYCVKVNIN